MKRAFSTVAFPNMDYEEIVNSAAKNHVAVEIRLDPQNNLFGRPRSDIPMITEAFKNAGVSISDIGTSVTIKGYNEEQVKKYCDCLDVAKAIGAKGARVFLANFFNKFTANLSYDYDGIVKALKEASDYGEKIGVEIWVETHNEFAKGEVLAKLWEDVGSNNLKFIWDFMHPLEQFETAEDTMKYIGDKVAHVHIKDGRKLPDINESNYYYTKLGEGDVPVAEMIALLENAGYDGYYSLEWEAAWKPQLKNLYLTPDELLKAYNDYFDSIEKNLLPIISSDKWSTFVPNGKNVVLFEKSKFNLTLNTTLSSSTYGLGKWITEVNVKPGWYDFSVSCISDSTPHDLYVIYTTLNGDKVQIREHAENCELRDGRYYFSDKIEVAEGCNKVRIELWLKGRYANVRWFAPSLIPANPPTPRVIRVANAFLESIHGRTLDGNKERILKAIDRAAAVKPDIITLSESMYHFGTGVSAPDAALSVNDPFIAQIREKAKEYSAYIIFNLCLKEGVEYFNASLLINRGGDIVGIQRKTHLTVTEYECGLTPGDGYEVFETDFGIIGMQICWDHYFANPEEALNEKGAEIVFVSSIGDANEKSVARAMDSGVYYVICGHHNENAHGWGASRIIDPLGRIVAHSDNENEVVYADIDLNKKIRRGGLSLGAPKTSVKATYKFERHPII